MLISLSGLPGVGKTTIARELARQIGAVHLSIDTIEQAIRSCIGGDDDRYRAAYRAALELARDNLRLGRTVITDCVNPIAMSRDAWRDMARSESVPLTEVEIVCSDAAELHSRCNTRVIGRTPQWQHVARAYQPWTRDRVVIDTAARDVAECVAALRSATTRI
jgi:predicted kinase